MKRLLIIFLSMFLLCSCGKKAESVAQSSPVTEQTERRKAEDSSDSAWAKKLDTAPSEAAPLVRRTKYDGEGNVVSWVDYSLNADGRPLKATPHSAEGHLTDEDYLITYEYTNGYLTAENDYSSDGERLIYRRKYDAAGQETKWILYDENGKVGLWYEKAYNEQGDCVSHLMCKEGEVAKVMNLREYDYDESGHITQCRCLSEKGGVIHLYDYTYELDGAGRVVSYRQYDSSASLLVEWFRYAYDEAGRLARKEQLDGGERVLIRTDYQYDSAGRVIREQIYSSDGALAVIMENSYQ